MNLEITPATHADVEDLVRIHQEGIKTTTATFESTPRSPEAFLNTIESRESIILTAKEGNQLLGFASLTPIEDRCTQKGVGEYGIYLAEHARNRGIGNALLKALIDQARAYGYHKIIGRIFTDNPASLALAKRFMFRTVGTLQNHGKIAGKWKHVVIVERLLEKS